MISNCKSENNILLNYNFSIELSRVEQFRRQQQKMEEENKQRRQILTNAIKQRLVVNFQFIILIFY